MNGEREITKMYSDTQRDECERWRERERIGKRERNSSREREMRGERERLRQLLTARNEANESE